MQLGDLVKPISQMSPDELMARLQEIRTNRTIVRPAAKARADREEKKTQRGRGKKIATSLGSMTEEERQQLIAQLQQGELDV